MGDAGIEVWRLPWPTSENAPRFMHTQSGSEVYRFVKTMDIMFRRAGITDNQEKKERIVDYVDAQTEDEWRAFVHWDAKSDWTAFVKEVYDSYPGADEEAYGSVSRLYGICQEHAGLGQSDGKKIHSLMRKVEGEKLVAAGVLRNGYLVAKFLECFTPAFEGRIRMFASKKYGDYNDETRKRHKDDPYDLEEIFDIVTMLAEDGPGYSERRQEMNRSPPRGVASAKEEGSVMEEQFASLHDAGIALGKEMQSVLQMICDELKTIRQFMIINSGNRTCRSCGADPALVSASTWIVEPSGPEASEDVGQTRFA
ncbi:hypothetical protein C0995_000297 [Termitomyces sp. Mi166|nr:hypothetical protein C0995_000297 [Termitomyces sp. Mi166\